MENPSTIPGGTPVTVQWCRSRISSPQQTSTALHVVRSGQHSTLSDVFIQTLDRFLPVQMR